MKKRARTTARQMRVAEDDILPEYDLSAARPNPYANRTAGTSVTVVLDPAVARIFPHAAAVNDALRALSRIAERSQRRPRSKRTSA